MTIEILQFADGSLPEGWRVGLLLLQGFLGKTNELVYILFACHTCVDHSHPFVIDRYHLAFLVLGIRVECFLRVVDKVLYQVAEYSHIRILSVYSLYSGNVAIVAHTPLHAEHVSLSGKLVACLDAVACIHQGSSIDILHHVLIYAGAQL